jgi:hypothetical protein
VQINHLADLYVAQLLEVFPETATAHMVGFDLDRLVDAPTKLAPVQLTPIVSKPNRTGRAHLGGQIALESEAIMRPADCALLAMLVSACSACQSNDPNESIDVVPGGITIDAQRAITGHWSVVEGKRVSRAKGGACMVVRYNEMWPGGPGATNEQECTGNAVLIWGVGSYGYYLSDGTCWIKPPTGTCNRTIDAKNAKAPTRWDVGNHLTNSTPLKLTVPPGHRPYPNTTYWRVSACLFEYVDGKEVMTCKWGKPQRIDRDLRPQPNP